MDEVELERFVDLTERRLDLAIISDETLRHKFPMTTLAIYLSMNEGDREFISTPAKDIQPI